MLTVAPGATVAGRLAALAENDCILEFKLEIVTGATPPFLSESDAVADVPMATVPNVIEPGVADSVFEVFRFTPPHPQKPNNEKSKMNEQMRSDAGLLSLGKI
jgi:hypothetical protein